MDPTWAQVDSKLSQVGSMLAPSWLQLASTWAYVDLMLGPFPGPRPPLGEPRSKFESFQTMKPKIVDLETLLAPLGGPLEAMMDVLGGLWRPCWASWGQLEPTNSDLEPSWSQLGTT